MEEEVKSKGAGKKKAIIISIIATICAAIIATGCIFLFGGKEEEPKTYTVKYMCEDLVSKYSEVTLNFNDDIDRLITYKEGTSNLIFEGWYLDKDFLVKIESIEDIDKDYVLYPLVRYEYNVTFKANDLISNHLVLTLGKGEVVSEIDPPSHQSAHAIFKGWYLGSSFDVKYEFGGEVTSDIVLYPLFENQYTITFMSFDNETTYHTSLFGERDLAIAPTPPSHLDRYAVFKGWYLDKKCTEAFTFGRAINENYVLYPLFKYEYIVIFKQNDLETNYLRVVYGKDEPVVMPSINPTHTNSYAVFKGWYLDKNFEREFVFNTSISEHITLYPKFEMEYEITYKNIDYMLSFTVQRYGESEITAPPQTHPQHADKYLVFRGWYLDEEGKDKFTFGTTIDRHYTLYPYYEYEYTLTFKASDLETDYKVDILDEDDKTVRPATPPHSSPYAVFRGWYSESTFENKFTFGTTINKAYTLYPLFEFEYDVVFMKADLNTSFRVVTLGENDVTYYVNPPSHSSPYAVFKGWYSDKELINRFTFGTTIDRDYVLYPKFEIEYDIVYKSSDLTTTYLTQTLGVTDLTSEPSAPSHSSPYAVFRGWYTDSTFERVFTFGTTINKDYILYPLFEMEYEVTYMNATHDSVYRVDILGENDLVTQPTAPTHSDDSAVFEGWYLDSALTSKFTFGNTLTSDITLYPKYDFIYQVVFMFNGETYNSQDVMLNGYPTDLENPSKDGYEFDGWTINGTNLVIPSSLKITTNVTFNAVFTKLHTVTFTYEGSTYATQTIRNGNKPTNVDAPSTTYKVFNGWKLNGTIVDETAQVITADTTFVADITYKYDVRFMSFEAVHNSQIVIKDSYPTLPASPTKDGYEFDGWTLNGQDIINPSEIAINETTTFNAVFTKLHTVTFTYEGSTQEVQTIRNGNKPTNVDAPSTTYKVFNGWKLNGTIVDETAQVITADTTFVADITYKYDVKFMVDSTAHNSQIVVKDSYPTLPASPTKDGYEFDGWTLNGQDIINPSEIAINETTTFNAVFTKLHTVTFTYEGSTYTTQTVRSGGKPTNVSVTSTNYKVFNGWKLNGTIVDETAQVIIANTTFVADITYKYDVVFKVDGNTHNSQIIALNSYPTNPTNPSKSGYEFDGWTLNGQDIINPSEIAINETTTFNAVFTKLHTVTFTYEGSTQEVQTIRNGNKPTNVDAPSTTYKVFNGWKLNGTIVDETAQVITANTTFVADITYKYDVKFMVDSTTHNSQIVTLNSYPSNPTNPSKSGYEFDGWTLNGQDVINPSEIAINETTTFNAVFTKLHTVTFTYEGSTYTTQTIRNGNKPTNVDAPSTTYKVFNGWKLNGTIVTVANQTITANTTFVADITYKYDVVFKVDGNTHNSQIVVKDSYPTLPASPTKDGYEFDGWTLNGSIVTPSSTKITGATTFTAKFTKLHTVTFTYEGSTYATQTIRNGNKPTNVDVTSTTYKVFNGWKLNGTIVTVANQTITANTTFVADITYKYDVVFKVDGNTHNSQIIALNSYPTNPTNPSKSGYEFDGWTLNGSIVTPSSTKITGNTTFTAKFTQLFTVTFTYEGSTYTTQTVRSGGKPTNVSVTSTNYKVFNGWKLNGTIVTVANQTITANTTFVADITYKYDVVFKVDGNTHNSQIIALNSYPSNPTNPSKSGYEFDGWTLNGSIVTPSSTKITGNTTFTAKFTQLFTVTFTYEGSTYATQTVRSGGKPTNVSVTSTNYKVFNGWKLNGTIVTVANQTITANTTFVADITYKHLVQFKSNGSVISSSYVVSGSYATAPSNPTLTDYTFSYWTTNGSTKVTLSSYTITADTTFIAKFTRTSYTGTFSSSNASVSNYGSYAVYYFPALGNVSDFNKSNYSGFNYTGTVTINGTSYSVNSSTGSFVTCGGYEFALTSSYYDSLSVTFYKIPSSFTFSIKLTPKYGYSGL